MLFVLIYSCGAVDTDAPPEPTRVSVQTKPSDVHGTGPMTHTDSDKSKSQGAADDEDKAIYTKDPDFAEVWRVCGWNNSGDGTGTANCIRKRYENLTTKAAACFGDFTECGARNCKMACFFSKGSSDGCKQCGRENCGDDWARCTGSPVEDIPR